MTALFSYIINRNLYFLRAFLRETITVFSGCHSRVLFKYFAEIPGIVVSGHITDFNYFFIGAKKKFFYFFHSYFCKIFNEIMSCFFFKKTAQVIGMEIKLLCQEIQADIFSIVLADKKLDFPDDILTQCLFI